MAPRDVDAADTVTRVAFGTFLGLSDPASAFGDAQHVRTRFAAAPSWAFVAESDEQIVGSVFVERWGSFGFFGPLTVRPDHWDQGVAQRLLIPVIDLFDEWRLRLSGLFTFAQSTKHVALYQRFGFWPQFLTAFMARLVIDPTHEEFRLLSALDGAERRAALAECAEVTDSVFDGLDVAHDAKAAIDQSLGDTVLVYDGALLAGFAVCHLGAGETQRDTLYVKFAAVRPGLRAAAHFDRLLAAVEQLALERGLTVVEAGMSTGRHAAYLHLLDRGYRSRGQGVRMQRPDAEGFCTTRDFVIDDLR